MRRTPSQEDLTTLVSKYDTKTTSVRKQLDAYTRFIDKVPDRTQPNKLIKSIITELLGMEGGHTRFIQLMETCAAYVDVTDYSLPVQERALEIMTNAGWAVSFPMDLFGPVKGETFVIGKLEPYIGGAAIRLYKTFH